MSRRALLVTAFAGASIVLGGTRTARAATAPFSFQAENRFRGTDRSQLPVWWGSSDLLEGFLGQNASTAQRRVVDLYVNSSAQTFRVSAYRLGHYAGLGQRLVWSSPEIAATRQARAAVHPVTRMVTCPWKISLQMDTSTWPEGFYYVVLTAPGAQAHLIPLVVESASFQGKAVAVFNDLTMQAYNHWGGASLYTGTDGSSPSRSWKVSFDRPYANPAEYEVHSAPLIRTAEAITDPRVSLAYTTEDRISGEPALLRGAAAVLFGGHSEYWTPALRRTVEAARDAGTNVVFFGANNVYWRARTEASALGKDRVLACFRDAALDPLSSSQPALATARWRDQPHPVPECSLTGTMYGDLGAWGTFTVTQPAFFGFQGTGVRRGETFAGLVGGETDSDSAAPSRPRNLLVFAHSPSTGVYRTRGWSDAAVFTVRSGAATINMASMNWLPAQYDSNVPIRSRNFARQVTQRIISEAARGPLGKRYGWPGV